MKEIPVKYNTLQSQTVAKAKERKRDYNFDHFVKTCLDELKDTGETICYSLKQLAYIGSKIPNIEYRKEDGVYYVRRIF